MPNKVSINVGKISIIFNDTGNVLLFKKSYKTERFPESWARFFIREFLSLIAFATFTDLRARLHETRSELKPV